PGDPCDKSLVLGEIERRGEARDVEEILEAADATVERSAAMEPVYPVNRIARVAEAERGAALAIEYTEGKFGVKGSRSEPGRLHAEVAQAFRAEGAGENQWFVDESPLMGMLGVLPAEGGEELAGLELEILRKSCAKQVSLFQFNAGLVVLVEF